MIRRITKRAGAGIAVAALALGLTGAAGVNAGDDGAAALTGRISFEGTAPAPETLDMSGDDYCADQHAQGRTTRAAVNVSGDGGLRGAIVHVREGVPSARRSPPAEEVLLDQQGCMYRPDVLALQTGQTLAIRNSDATLHNVHAIAERNREFNIGQPIRGITSRRKFDASEVGIHVICDIHGWMSAWIAVFDHPWFAVTGADGSFTLPDLPAGQYVIEAWHPTLGTRTRTVTVAPGTVPNLDITFGDS